MIGETMGSDTLPDLLRAGGAPDSLAPRVRDVLGDEAVSTLQADPWALLSIGTVPVEAVDGFARARLSGQADARDPRRVTAIVRWLLERAARDGNTTLPADILCSSLEHYGVGEPFAALSGVVESGELLAFSAIPEDEENFEEEPAPPKPADVLICLERLAFAEESVAEGVQRVIATVEPLDAMDGVDPDLASAISANGLLLLICRSPESLPAGLPGVAVGATAATVRWMGRLFDAPVVDARQAGASAELPGASLVVVGDAHLLDVEAAATLFEAIPDGAHVVLAGDPHADGPSGAGSVFRDLLSEDSIARFSLPEPTGVLAELRAAIRGGALPPVQDPEHRVVVVPARDSGEAVHRTLQLVTDSIPRTFTVESQDVLVVALRHGGDGGTTALNAAIKERINPGSGEYGGFDVGDVVTAVRSIPEAGLSGGELGKVTGADESSLTLDVSGRDEEVRVPLERAARLRHGWALTADQAAGESREAAAVVLAGEAAGGLTRAIVYGALGHATRHLSIVHSTGSALAEAVERIPDRPRRTRLKALLAQG